MYIGININLLLYYGISYQIRKPAAGRRVWFFPNFFLVWLTCPNIQRKKLFPTPFWLEAWAKNYLLLCLLWNVQVNKENNFLQNHLWETLTLQSNKVHFHPWMSKLCLLPCKGRNVPFLRKIFSLCRSGNFILNQENYHGGFVPKIFPWLERNALISQENNFALIICAFPHCI